MATEVKFPEQTILDKRDERTKDERLAAIQGITSPDEYYLESLDLITSVQNISLVGVMTEVSYYEDLFKGSTTGVVLLTDSLGLVDRLSMCGNEYLHFKFKKTKQAESNYSIEKYFRVYRVGERLLNNNTGAETYSLHFCSEELFLSEQLKISKAYDGMLISDIVSDILVKQMQIPEDKVSVLSTKNLYSFIVPYKKPFEAINWLSNYAQSEKYKGADYVFFENKNGFIFTSLQELYKKSVYQDYKYIARNAGNIAKTTELGRSIIGIKSYIFLDTYDTLYGLNMGAFSNKLITIDPLTRQYRETVFNYDKSFDTFKHLNPNKSINTSKNRLGKTLSESENAVLKVAVGNKDQKKAKYISDNPGRVGSVANDIDIENYVPNRTAQLAMSQYSRIRVTLSGDPNLTIGRTVNISLPSLKGTEATQQTDKDLYHTGKYLITAVRHIIDTNMKYETMIEVAKESLGAKLVDMKDTDEQAQNAIKNK